MDDWSDPAHIHPEIQRCTPGQTAKPVGCGVHDEHRWCAICDGWFDLYHVAHVPSILPGSLARPGLRGAAA